LALEDDLFDFDGALVPECLQLQVRVFELADRFPSAARLRWMTLASPMASLFAAILDQARVDKAHQVQIAFDPSTAAALRVELHSVLHNVQVDVDAATTAAGIGPRVEEGDRFSVFYLAPGGCCEAMCLPVNLANPLKGMVKLVEAVGLGCIRAYARRGHKLPDDAHFRWLPNDVLSIEI